MLRFIFTVFFGVLLFQTNPNVFGQTDGTSTTSGLYDSFSPTGNIKRFFGETIYFDISFHGPPSQRDEFIDEMRGRIEEIDLGIVETRPMDEVFEELGIPPRTEEDDKEDDATDAGEWDIEI